MAKTEKIYAPASWGELNALKALAEKVGGLDNVESFKREGLRFAAVIRVADDDEDKDESKDSDDDGDDKPAFMKSDGEKDEGGSDDSSSEDSESDSGDEDSSGDDDRSEPPFESEGDEEGGEPSISEVLDLVKEIAKAVGVPVADDLAGLPTDDLGAGDLAGADAPLDLPDVGAPPAGGPALPPPVPAPAPAGGPAGGARPKPGAMPSFAGVKVAGYDEAKAKKRSFDALLEEAGSVSNQQIMSEASAFFPDHRVAKIDRQSRAEDNVAVVTLVAR